MFPDIKADDVPEEVKEKIRALKKIREDLQAAMSEVGEDKVGSHVNSYIVESTMCMNMALTMLKDTSNVAKSQNKMIQEWCNTRKGWCNYKDEEETENLQ